MGRTRVTATAATPPPELASAARNRENRKSNRIVCTGHATIMTFAVPFVWSKDRSRYRDMLTYNVEAVRYAKGFLIRENPKRSVNDVGMVKRRVCANVCRWRAVKKCYLKTLNTSWTRGFSRELCLSTIKTVKHTSIKSRYVNNVSKLILHFHIAHCFSMSNIYTIDCRNIHFG